MKIDYLFFSHGKKGSQIDYKARKTLRLSVCSCLSVLILSSLTTLSLLFKVQLFVDESFKGFFIVIKAKHITFLTNIKSW